MNKKFDLNDEIINLRLLFMRTISSIWNNETNYSENIIKSPSDVFEKIIPESNNTPNMALNNIRKVNDIVHKSDSNTFEEVIKIIKANGLLRPFLELLSPSNLQKFFLQEFGASNDFANFGIQIIKPTARWNYYGDNQWTKPNTEALYLSLPTSLSKEDFKNDINSEAEFEYIKAEVLTQYYQNFPSFFGHSKSARELLNEHNDRPQVEKYNIRLEELEDFRFGDSTLDYYNTMDVDRDPSGNSYNLGLSEDAFLGFGAVIMKLIAILWDNKDLKNKLDYANRVFTETTIFQDLGISDLNSIHELNYILENADELTGNKDKKYSKEISHFNKKYDSEIKAIFKEHFDYYCPWVFNIRILSPESQLFDTKNWKDIFSKNTEILNLTTIEVPHSPDLRDVGDVTMALARYNATGPAYPFTCS